MNMSGNACNKVFICFTANIVSIVVHLFIIIPGILGSDYNSYDQVLKDKGLDRLIEKTAMPQLEILTSPGTLQYGSG